MHPKLMDWEGERVPKINEIWMLACIKNSLKNRWFRKPKFKKTTEKTLPWVLKSILERFWEGFGRPKWFQNRDFWYFFGYACGDLNFGRILLEF